MAKDSQARLVSLRDTAPGQPAANDGPALAPPRMAQRPPVPTGEAPLGERRPSGARSMPRRPPVTADERPLAQGRSARSEPPTTRRDHGRRQPAGARAERAGAPTDGDWKATLKSARVQMKADRASMAAGSFAYQWFLSLFPLVIALLGIAALVQIPHHVTLSLVKGVTKAIPAGAAGVLTGAITSAEKHSGGALPAIVIAALIALYSASAGMATVEQALDVAYQVPSDRGFVSKRLLAIALLGVSAVLGGAASAMIVFGPQIGSAIQGHLPIGAGAFSAAWTAVRWIVALLLISVLFSALYWLGPNRERPRWRWFSPGSLLGTAIWAAISIGFSFYTSSFGSGSYAKTYGAFAGVALLILWLYLTGYAIVAGGEVNAAFERRAAGAG